MTQPLVCDASAIVALLLDAGPAGEWVADVLGSRDVAAPALVDWEVADVIRRSEARGVLGAGQAAQAHADLLDLSVERWPFEATASRAWELRTNLTAYDAAYVALAELLDADLVTLDRRLVAAPGVRCRVLVPPGTEPAT